MVFGWHDGTDVQRLLLLPPKPKEPTARCLRIFWHLRMHFCVVGVVDFYDIVVGMFVVFKLVVELYN